MTTSQIERRNALVLEHLQIVEKIAGAVARRVPPSIQLDDLKQAGTMGLMEAATRYDATKGVPFVAWAIIRVRGAVLDCVQTHYKHAHTEQLQSACDGEIGGAHEMSSDHGAAAAAIEAACEARQQSNRIHLVVSNDLPRRERRVVELHYSKGHNMQIVARRMKVSPTRVFQLRASALETVREKLAA